MKGLRVPRALALPSAAWFGAFLLAPLGIVIAYSVSHKGTYGGVILGVTSANFARAWDWLYLRIVWQSLKLAALTTLSCLLLGFPMAYVLARAKSRARSALLVLVVLPFWTNFVVRAYALKLVLGVFDWNETAFAVWLGMVTNYLPFMVLPLYVALEKFDFTLLEAAEDLGERPWRAKLRVLFPLIRPGLVTGSILVFTPALGEFVIPDMLGGARTMLIGNLVTEQFLKARDWPFGSALAMILMLAVAASLALYRKQGEAL